jgi:hypothetical protein
MLRLKLWVMTKRRRDASDEMVMRNFRMSSGGYPMCLG